MNKDEPRPPESRPVDSSLYDESYFLTECEGHEEFAASGGQVLSKRLAGALAHADVRPGMRVLDVGCGRGESLIWLAGQGARVCGVDYAAEALRLTSKAVEAAGPGTEHNYSLMAANARYLPLASESFDRVLMLDIIEHLHPWELELALLEAWRVLKHGGQLIAHTAPNLWYYQFGYPLFRLYRGMQGVQLPRDPRRRFRYHQQVHVNEQSPRSLTHALRRAGFRPRVWLGDTQQRWSSEGTVGHALGWLVTHCYPFKWVFCGDVLGVGYKV